MSVIEQVARIATNATHCTWNHTHLQLLQLDHYNYFATMIQLFCNYTRNDVLT